MREVVATKTLAVTALEKAGEALGGGSILLTKLIF